MEKIQRLGPPYQLLCLFVGCTHGMASKYVCPYSLHHTRGNLLGIGVGELCRYFSLGVAGLFFKFDLAIGLVNILLGILLLLHPLDAIVFLPIAAGLFILIGSSFDIQLAVEMHHLGAKHWWLTMALGILSTIFAFFLIFDPFNGTTALMIFAGISLIVSSIESFYLIVCISKAVKSSKDDDIIDVTWTAL